MPEPSPFIDAVAERYRVERELGRGGMATVYLAHDLRHDRPVAIKVLNPELAEWLGAERFLAEIRTTARLQHAHILPLLDSGSVRGRDADGRAGPSFLYYVMPLVTGGTLRARLNRERQLSVPEAVRIAREVAEALAHAHACGIVHRDIKPENILLGAPSPGSASAPALVADFGIARSLDAAERLTSSGVTLGTASYMSPEQATAERDIDGRSDIYSLGCVLYEMLAGEPPFTGPNPRSILAKQLSDPVRPVRRLRDGVPPHVDAALATALGRTPADRHPDAESFAAALAGTGQGATAGSVGAAAAARVGAPDRRRRAMATMAVIAAAAAAAWAVVPRPDSDAATLSVRVQRFTTTAGDTANAYLAATLQQDVAAALTSSRSARVFAMDSARLPSGYAVGGVAVRGDDSVEIRLSVAREPDGEFVGRRSVKTAIGRVHEIPALATDAILEIVGRPRAATVSQRAPTRDSIAYDLFLKGRYQTDRRTEASTRRALALFRAAVARDSSFAEGWAGLTRALQQVYLRGYRIDIPRDRILSELYDASDRALAADSTRSYVWIARGIALRDLEPSSRRNAVLAYQKAIVLDSTNADAWHYAAVGWIDSLEPARALASWRRALSIDPTHRQALGFLGQYYNWMRQYDSAFAWADSGRRIDPTHILIRQQLAHASFNRGDTATAAENYRAIVQIGKGPDEVMGWVGLVEIAVRSGDRRSADTLLTRALALVDTLHPALHDAAFVASAYVTRGDTARAVGFLERYAPRADMHFQLHLHCDVGLDPLRGMPRFRALLVRAWSGCR